ncbi:glycosyltransferase family 2 protein [Methanobrevibacter millerae]|uniref:Glycosyl transferase family 2 n=1 Tax=Methanobrevibacter millerae TaxID=230361 RepID=A0A1G5WXZ1_9EURY|nr:glycosyltransferase family 2 protein [Methanobrevibacter millerae]SDA62536.1 Glycosyl transferase family 2 [Methanobrevibacter millerae]
MYLISLIIPIYNAEEFLDNTINSVINQSIGFNNIELILVDDNSKDESKKIIEQYAEKYDNIIPYYSEINHGFPGFGRNIGLEKATADYIMFMDNDDEIDVDMCKKLYETMINEKADVVCCDRVIVDSLSEIKSNIDYVNGIENNDHIIIENDDILLFNNISVWNKIYKKQIIIENELKFKENTSADDFIFMIQYFLKSKKLIYLKNYFGYYWNIKSDSLSHVSSIGYVEEMLSANYIIINILKNENKLHLANDIFKDNIVYLLVQCSYLNVTNKEFIDLLKKIHEFEIEIDFKIKLDEKWANIINQFILDKKFKYAIISLKTLNTIRKITFIRKIKRNTN